ncbi:unnamed protein product [Brassica napus]|uniref:(rape) hypothetical protein n=1 Tax=Brassica napus TaxID=3708 RepID=A0A817AL69_BRANA|nr:unnamed protein product [Brassica napus]
MNQVQPKVGTRDAIILTNGATEKPCNRRKTRLRQLHAINLSSRTEAQIRNSDREKPLRCQRRGKKMSPRVKRPEEVKLPRGQ